MVVSHVTWRAQLRSFHAVLLPCQRNPAAIVPLDAQFLEHANGASGQNVPSARILMTRKSSEPGSGSKTSFPSVGLIIASTILQLTNLTQRNVMCHGAKFPALANGASLVIAPPSGMGILMEDSIAAMAPRRGPSSFHSRLSSEVKNAATTMETRIRRSAAIVVVQKIASDNGAHGVIAAPLVVVEPGRESSKSHKR